jgi:hypothetical protein
MVAALDTGGKISVVKAGSIGVYGNVLHQLRHILVPFFTTWAGINPAFHTVKLSRINRVIADSMFNCVHYTKTLLGTLYIAVFRISKGFSLIRIKQGYFASTQSLRSGLSKGILPQRRFGSITLKVYLSLLFFLLCHSNFYLFHLKIYF